MRVNQSIPKPFRIVILLFLGLWAIPVIWITAEGVGLWVDHIRLSQFGVVTQGVVTDTRMVRHRYVSYFVKYEYSPQINGGLLKQEVQVSEPIFENTTVGDSILVCYLQSDPEVSNLEGNDPLQITNLRMGMVLSPMILLTGMLIGSVYLSRRRGWL